MTTITPAYADQLAREGRPYMVRHDRLGHAVQISDHAGNVLTADLSAPCEGRHCADHADERFIRVRESARAELLGMVRGDARKRWDVPSADDDHTRAGMLPHDAPIIALGTHPLEEDYGTEGAL